MQVAGQAIAETCGLQDADHAAFTLDGWPAGYSAWVSRGKDNSQKQLDTYLYGARKKIRSQLELRQHFKNFCAALPCAIQNPQNAHNLQRAVSSSRPIPPPPRQIPSQLDPLQPISSQTNSSQLRPVNRPAAPAYNPARPHLIRPGELAPFQDGNGLARVCVVIESRRHGQARRRYTVHHLATGIEQTVDAQDLYPEIVTRDFGGRREEEETCRRRITESEKDGSNGLVLGGERIVQGDIMRITLPQSLRTEHNTRHTMLLTNEIVQLNSGVFLNGHLVSLVCSPDKPSSSTTTDTPLLPPAPSGLKWKLHRKVSIPLCKKLSNVIDEALAAGIGPPAYLRMAASYTPCTEQASLATMADL
ncbi:hypothetical protein C6P46_004621 [Rhodotorula mucilaginosa]|uniref:Cryptic loci regulator 2 N-terminal domain-containing protein n=1 Tax=Rhodotorula mucilaginosa TaxID=5537 RepID=A0A9P7B5V9_RHOMI|nr:hypothetical protein C6P46_004621 [Rhodotorula mucilaginosa]